MLAKLLHYEQLQQDIPVHIGAIANATKTHYEKLGNVSNVSKNSANGTLGLFFTIAINDKIYFAKTHLPTEAHRATFRKEVELLKALYRDRIYIEDITVNVDGFTHIVSIVDMLTIPNETPTPTEVRRILKELQARLGTITTLSHPEIYKQIGDTYNQEYLCEKAVTALTYILKHGFITKDLEKECREIIIQGARKYPIDRIISHGDLSNKNILKKDDEWILIDWEDAIFADREYDYYYWLTFFDQQKFYATKEFTNNCSDNNKCLYYMLLVVILKCYLSIINLSYKNNKTSIEDRLRDTIRVCIGGVQ